MDQFGGFVHVDTDFLENASFEALAGVMVHEAWHLLMARGELPGGVHHPETTWPYSTHPFNLQVQCQSNYPY